MYDRPSDRPSGYATWTAFYVMSYACADGRCHTAAPGVHPTSTSRDVSDQAFPSLSNFYCVLRCACGGRPGNEATICHGFVSHGFVRLGFVGHGFVRHGFVRHGIVQRGFVRHGIVHPPEKLHFAKEEKGIETVALVRVLNKERLDSLGADLQIEKEQGRVTDLSHAKGS